MKKFFFILIIIISSFFFNTCEKEVFTGINEIEYIENGKIYLSSNPTNAKIYLDGKNTGLKTPDSLTWLKSGNHAITLKMDYFKDTVLNVTAEDKKVTDLFVDYYLNPGHFGKIECKSNPDNAEIIFNDNPTGLKTPHTFTKLFPGYYKVKFNYPEHWPDSSVIRVDGGKTTQLYLKLVDTTTWVNYSIKNSKLTSNHLSVVVVDKNNVKWVGTRDKGLLRFDGKEWTSYRKDNSPLPFDFINSVAVDNQNNIWVGTTGGLVVYNNGNWTNYTSQLPDVYVTSVASDQSGNTWVGTQKGLAKFDGASWQTFNTSNSGLPGNFVTSIAADNQNRIWIGTNAFGISMFDGSKWVVYNMSNMRLPVYAGNDITNINVDKNGIVWAAHLVNDKAGNAGGLTKFDGTSWSYITLNGVLSTQIDAIYVDNDNYKWVGTKNGLTKFLDPSNEEIYFNTLNSQLPASQVKGIALDAKGDLWIATFGGGLAKLKKGNF